MKRKFFAAFLSLCMVMSLVPMTALAAPENDGAGTPSTQAATELPGAVDGVITLTGPVDLKNAWEPEENVTLNLNGNTLTLPRLDAGNGVTITITDSQNGDGKIVATGTISAVVWSGGTLVLEDGTITSTSENLSKSSNIAVFNMGTFTIRGGKVEGGTNGGTGVYNTAWNGQAKITTPIICNVEGGEIEGSYSVCAMGPGVPEGGLSEVNNEQLVINITDGTIMTNGQGIATNASSGMRAGFTINMSGGSIVDKDNASTGMYLPAIGVTNITGGTITAAQGIRIGAGELNITGGTVTCTVKANGEDLIPGESGGTTGAIVVGKASAGYVGDIEVNVSGNAVIQNTASRDNSENAVYPTIVVSDKNMANTESQAIKDPATGQDTGKTFSYSNTKSSVNVSANVDGDIVKISALGSETSGTQDGGNTTLTLTNANITGNIINQTKEGDVDISGSTITGNVTNASKGEVVISNNSKIDGTVSNTGTSGDDEKGYVAILDSTVTGAINNAAENNITIVNSTVNNVPTTNTEGKVAMIGAKTYDTLEKAIEAAQDGGTVVLLADITNENVGTIDDDADTVLTIDKSITIQGNGNEISIDLSIPDIFEDRDQIFSIGETKESTVAVTLDGVTMNIKGNNTGKGDAFDVWGTLNITNGSNITVKNAQSAFTMQGGENAKVNIDKASTVTANNIHGNFSNGGIWTIKEGSSLDINTAGNHGLSVEELTVDASTVSVDGAAYTGILAATVTLENDANVTVTNCGKDLPQKSQWAPDKESYKNAMELKGETPTLTVDNSTLTLTNNVNKDGTAINSIYLGKGTLTQQNNPTINVDKIVTSDEATTQYYVVTYMSNGEKWDSEVVNTGSVTLPEIPDQGYNHFQGWTDQAGNRYNGGQTVKIEKDTTFTAVWSYIPPANPNYKITIGAMENGTVTANPTAAKAGATVTLTPVPDEGYALSTLTVTDRFGDAVRVTEQADGTYTFTMPNGQVTVNATFVETEEPVAEPFVDVAEGDWFYDAVVYAYQNELMDGVGGNRFAPNSETTRAQLVTILYRLEGQPAVSGDLPFTDVETGIWYTDAILWAAQNNIVNGVSDTEFAPGDDLTRQQLVTILYRYAEAKGYDVSASADLSGYPDADQVQDYAQPAMAWAVAENIIQGMEDGTLKPAGNASRAQIATILMRFCEDVAQ